MPRLGTDSARRVLTFPKPEGDEAVSGIVGRYANLDPIPGDHANPEAAHAARKLRGHELTTLEGYLVATTAENLVDGSGRLNQIVTCQTGLQFEKPRRQAG